MNELILEDVRRIMLGLLFVVAFGWMAAEVVPGADASAPAAQQLAAGAELVPPKP